AKAKAAVMMHKVQTPVTVANVVEVGKEGAVAICGCGHKAAVNASTAYLEVGDKTYAACSEGCKAHMAKDADKSAEMIEAKVAEYHHNH
ncbi:MAG TPA: hypothetical protein VLB27_02245, partial [candidate division Zixibacteria bacterium]|nr:hypothetical protein [candidate division Zixibacteria bacterium]